MKKPFCILFAGVVGSSKTPIATYLSYTFKVPIFNNDAIRSEVTEDLSKFDEKVYLQRRDARLKKIIQSKTSFIYDASVDRAWAQAQGWLEKADYNWFIISLDLNKKFIEKLYTAKGYSAPANKLPALLADHEEFLRRYGNKVGLHITEKKFKRRLTVSAQAVKKWFGAQQRTNTRANSRLL